MLRSLLKNIIVYACALYIIPFLVPGVNVRGGLMTYVVSGLMLAFMFVIVKPVFSILTFPLNFLTMGAFSIVVNSVLLYLVTVFIPNIIISPFTYQPSNFFGFVTPLINVNTLFTFILASCALSISVFSVKWLARD